MNEYMHNWVAGTDLHDVRVLCKGCCSHRGYRRHCCHSWHEALHPGRAGALCSATARLLRRSTLLARRRFRLLVIVVVTCCSWEGATVVLVITAAWCAK